jgi:hypothetical protein
MADFQMRIEDEGGRRVLLVQPIEQVVEQRGLAGADFAGEHEETFARLDAVLPAVPRFRSLTSEKQVAGIGVDVERVLAQSKELVVHVRVAPPGGYVVAQISKTCAR